VASSAMETGNIGLGEAAFGQRLALRGWQALKDGDIERANVLLGHAAKITVDAIEIGKDLIKRDSNNPLGHLLVSEGQFKAGEYGESSKAAEQAFMLALKQGNAETVELSQAMFVSAHRQMESTQRQMEDTQRQMEAAQRQMNTAGATDSASGSKLPPLPRLNPLQAHLDSSSLGEQTQASLRGIGFGIGQINSTITGLARDGKTAKEIMVFINNLTGGKLRTSEIGELRSFVDQVALSRDLASGPGSSTVEHSRLNDAISTGFRQGEVAPIGRGLRDPAVKRAVMALQGRGQFANDVDAYQALLGHARSGKIFTVGGEAARQMQEMGIEAHAGKGGLYIRSDIFSSGKIAHETGAVMGRPHEANLALERSVQRWGLSENDSLFRDLSLRGSQDLRAPPDRGELLGTLPDGSNVYKTLQTPISDFAARTKITSPKKRISKQIPLRAKIEDAIEGIIRDSKYEISDSAIRPFERTIRSVARDTIGHRTNHSEKYGSEYAIERDQLWISFLASDIGANSQKIKRGLIVTDAGVVLGADCSLGKTEVLPIVTNSIHRLTRGNKIILYTTSDMGNVEELMRDNASISAQPERFVKLTEESLRDAEGKDTAILLEPGKTYLTENKVAKELAKRGVLKKHGKDIVYIADEIQSAAADSKLVDAMGIKYEELVSRKNAGDLRALEALGFSERAMQSLETLEAITNEAIKTAEGKNHEVYDTYTDHWVFKKEIGDKIEAGYAEARKRNPGLLKYEHSDLVVLRNGLAWTKNASDGKHYKVVLDRLGYESRNPSNSRTMHNTQLGDEGRGLNARASFLALRIAREKGLSPEKTRE
ncbi:hypothetical protein ACFL2Y_05510, partial [Candidatus Omnitrophota bacterium]